MWMGSGASGLGKLHRWLKEKNSPSKLTPFSSPDHSSRSTSMASSARRPRVAKSAIGIDAGMVNEPTAAPGYRAMCSVR